MPTVTKQTRNGSTRAKSALDRIVPIGFEDGEGIKLSLYGVSGTGKTTLWATFPKPILALVCSGGSKPGELRSINTAENRKQIKQLRVEKSSDVREVAEHQAASGEFKTIVLDHATHFQDLVLSEILGIEQMPEQLSWGLATQQQYRQCTLQMKALLRGLLDLSCHVVIIAQEREFNVDGDSGLLMPHVGSALTPSTAGWLNAAVDYIGQTFLRQRTTQKEVKVGAKTSTVSIPAKGVDYCLRTGPNAVYTTKFRVPKEKALKLPDVIVDPTFEKIMDAITGETKPERRVTTKKSAKKSVRK